MPFGVGDGKSLSSREANFDGEEPYGDAPKQKVNGLTVRRVGSYNANALGLFDVHGNVWEWCADLYGEYDEKVSTNPTGPSTGRMRVLRGGCCYIGGEGCRSANRGRTEPETGSAFAGFRLARIAQPAAQRLDR